MSAIGDTSAGRYHESRREEAAVVVTSLIPDDVEAILTRHQEEMTAAAVVRTKNYNGSAAAKITTEQVNMMVETMRLLQENITALQAREKLFVIQTGVEYELKLRRTSLVPEYDGSGRILTLDERREIASRMGVCTICFTFKTHFVKGPFRRKKPITSENVYKGTCIECHPDQVPGPILEAWRSRASGRPSPGGGSDRTSTADMPGMFIGCSFCSTMAAAAVSCYVRSNHPFVIFSILQVGSGPLGAGQTLLTLLALLCTAATSLVLKPSFWKARETSAEHVNHHCPPRRVAADMTLKKPLNHMENQVLLKAHSDQVLKYWKEACRILCL